MDKNQLSTAKQQWSGAVIKMQGLTRLGGSGKYKNIDGALDLMPPVMVADPSRGMKPEQSSLSYNNMLLRQDGGVLSHEHIREMRDRQGYCLTCTNEPTQLFEIKRSKINPLFRAKEAIDSIHESYNGICLICNPHMDPHRMIRRESLQMAMSRRSSIGSKSASVDSIESFPRSRSSSPGDLHDANDEGQGSGARPRPLRVRKAASTTKRDRTRDVFSPLRKGSLSGSDLTAQETPVSAKNSDRSLGAYGTPTNGISEVPADWTPGSQFASHSGSSSSSLGSMIRTNKPPINKSNMEEFSMPDFSEGSSNFKSHRKSKQKESHTASPPPAPAVTMKPSKSGLTMVKEEKRRETSASSSNFGSEFFADFDEPSFTPVPIRKKTLKRHEPSLSDARPDEIARSFFDNVSEPFPGTGVRQDSNPFGSDLSGSESEPERIPENNDSWSPFGESNTSNAPWPPAPSIQSEAENAKTRGRLRRGSGSQSNSDDSAFLAPPSRTSSTATQRLQHANSESSINIHDAILKISVSGNHQDSLTPSQLIEADEQLMLGISGIKVDATTEVCAEKTAEVEDLKSLLQDVAAAGSSDVLIDMLVTAIRENTNSIPIQEVCLKQIWDHSKFNEVHKTEIMNAGLAVDIIRAMKSHRRSKKVQENACGCLWSLSVSERNRPALARAGAVKMLFRTLEDFIEDEVVLEVIFGSLRTLSPDKNVRDAIVPLLGARRVCRAMGKHRSSTAIQRDGCAFLSNISVDMDNQMVSTVHNDELAAVVRALGDHLRNESVVSSACFALKNYTYEEKNLRNLRRFEEAIALLEDASKYSTKAEIRLDANEIIERIQLSGEEDDALEEIAYSSLRDAMQSPRMTADQAVETIRDVMKQYEWSEKLLVFGLGSLLSLSRQSEEYMTRITQFDVLKIIVHTMYKQQVNANIQHRGCETLKFLAEQGNRPRTMICDVDGSSILISALRFHRNNETVKAVAIAALEELSKDPRCAHLINKELSDTDLEQSGELGNSLASFGESFKTAS